MCCNGNEVMSAIGSIGGQNHVEVAGEDSKPEVAISEESKPEVAVSEESKPDDSTWGQTKPDIDGEVEGPVTAAPIVIDSSLPINGMPPETVIGIKYMPRWFNRSNGWSGTTYPEAVEFCASVESRVVCPFEGAFFSASSVESSTRYHTTYTL